MSAPLVLDLRYATAHYPGVGSYAVGLAEALLAARREWPWRVLMPPAGGRFDLAFVPAAARDDRTASTPGPVRDQFALGGRLREMNAALYHSPYYLRPWGARCPSILTVHDVIPIEHRASMSAPKRALYRWLIGDALRADCVVTDSGTSRDAIRAAFPRARRPAPSAPGAASSRRAEGADARADPIVVPPGCRVIEGGEPWAAWPRPAVLTVGINKPHKNLEVLMRALAMIPIERRPLLLCAGPADRRYPDARALAGWHGVTDDVVVLGMVPEQRLAALYRSAALFAFPTRLEGFGLPLLEAMTLGVPAIVSDLPVLREIAGESAWRLSPDDPAAWARAIATLLDDRARTAALADLGRARAAEFSYAAAARQIVREYEALVPALASGAARPAGAVHA